MVGSETRTNSYSRVLSTTCMHACVLSRFSHVWLFVTLWPVACQAPLSTGLSRQEYWSGLPGPPPGDLPDPGIKPRSPALQADSFTAEPPGKPVRDYCSALKRNGIQTHATTPQIDEPWKTMLSKRSHSPKDKYRTIPLIWGTQTNQSHRDKQ